MPQNETLAIDGGAPVRTKPFPPRYLGAALLGKEELALLTEVIETKLPFRDYGNGTPHMVNDFEREACAYFGMKHALATATGSGSFYCAMAGLGVGPGDEVIIPSLAWYTDFEAPVLVGATPVFADIDRSLNMSPDDFERKITPRTRAVIVVHFQGATNDMDRLLAIARAHSLKVVEDCAQACGAIYKGRKVGSLGDVSCFSFQQNKIMTTGDGGLLLTDDPVLFERAARFHDLGLIRKALLEQVGGTPRVEPFCGCQFRMNEFTGAVALAQLRKLDPAIVGVTRPYHRRLRECVRATCPGLALRRTGDPDGDAGIAFYMDLETRERAKWFKNALAAEGIPIGPSSSCTNMLREALVQGRRRAHPALPPFGPGWPDEHRTYTPELCPNTDPIFGSMICIALTPQMTSTDIDDIARAIGKVWAGRPSAVFP